MDAAVPTAFRGHGLAREHGGAVDEGRRTVRYGRRAGDPSYRVIPCTATEPDIVASHLHIENAYLQQDLDVALPLRRLDELVRAGVVGGVAPSHYSFQGYLLDPTEFLATSVPAMVEQMKRERVDAAVFVPV